MKRITGLGGIFFRANNPSQLKAWYQQHLGIDHVFRWKTVGDDTPHYTVWNAFEKTASIFEKTEKEYVFNYCVADLELLMDLLKEEGVGIIQTSESDVHGKFGSILDPEGNKIVLWEPSGKEVGPFSPNLDRVTGLGGVFFKVQDPEKTKQWYGKHLGLPVDAYGASLRWVDPNDTDATVPALTAWSPFKSDTKYFAPSEKSFMFNYRVKNLLSLLDALTKEGVQTVGQVEEYSYGKFGWIVDPEANKIELWEPKDEGF